MSIKYIVKQFCKKHKRVYYFARCIRNANDSEFISEITQQYSGTATHVKIMRMGSLNEGKVIFLMDVGKEIYGFFGHLARILYVLYFCDKYTLTPVISFNEYFMYSEKEREQNAFEYYFKQPSGISVQEAHESALVIVPKEGHALNVFCSELGNKGVNEEGYRSFSTDYMEIMSRMYEKYIHLNEAVEEAILNDINVLYEGVWRKDVIGCHVRGGDYNKLIYGHPVPINPEMCAEEVEVEFFKHKFTRIFLATDDARVVRIFQQKFDGKLLLFHDSYRVTDDNSIMLRKKELYLNGFKMGMDALRDAYALAACSGLISGASALPLIARLIKMSRDEAFNPDIMIDLGMNRDKSKQAASYGNYVWQSNK